MRKFVTGVICFAAAIALLCSCGSGLSSQEDASYEEGVYRMIYVSKDGKDRWKGTSKKPFATIARAQEEVREISEGMTGDIIVQIGPGVYQQTETLMFDERDSGKNGYKVIYRGDKEDFPVISGGKKVTGWKPYENGIWRAKAAGVEMIRELYVNGEKQLLARTNTKVKGNSFYHPSGQMSTNAGIVMDKEILEGLTNVEDLVFRYDVAWMCYFSRCEGIVKAGADEYAAILQPSFHSITTRDTNPPNSYDRIYIENAYELLDAPGEFYYNAQEDYLYYMPTEDVDLKTADVYIPILEELVHISGTDLAHKASDITFENLHFAHAAYFYPMQYGFNSTQAQWVSTMTGDGEVFFTPSNITLDAAERISFLNNDFSGLAAVALGIHEGVNDTSIVGNTFYDIKDSAISVGLLTHDYIDETEEYYDLARKADVTASAYSSNATRPGKSNDGNVETGWRADTETPEWVQYDLGGQFQVGAADFYLKQGAVTEVQLSNDADFKKSVSLRLDAAQDVVKKQSFNISEVTFTKYAFTLDNPENGESYRYLRALTSDNAWICETKIFDYARAGVPLEEVCKNTFINNNYFYHVADYYWSSPAVVGYYVDSLEVSHNYFNNISYTAISCGWGWDNNRDSTTCRNNRIVDNYIKDCTLECYDGGGIYTLGNQPGSVFSGNYIYGQHFPTASLYMDNGSSDLLWENNVTEDMGHYFFAGGSTRNLVMRDNYTSADINSVNSDAGSELVDTHVFPKFLPVGPARVIMENAGLEDAYVPIVDRVPVPENYSQFGAEGYTNIVDNGLYQLHTAKYIFLECEMKAVETALELTVVGDGLWQFTAEAKEQLSAALQQTKAVYSDPGIVPSQKYYDEWLVLRDAYAAFLESRNKLSYADLKLLVEESLNEAQAGTEEGCYPEEAIQRLRSQLNDRKILKTRDEYLDLEQSYFAFLSQQVTGSQNP